MSSSHTKQLLEHYSPPIPNNPDSSSWAQLFQALCLCWHSTLPLGCLPHGGNQESSRVLSAFLTSPLPPITVTPGPLFVWIVFLAHCLHQTRSSPRVWAQSPFGSPFVVHRDLWALPLPHRNPKHRGGGTRQGSWFPSAARQLPTLCLSQPPVLNWGCIYRRCLHGQLFATL